MQKDSDVVLSLLVRNGKKLTTKRQVEPKGRHILMYVFCMGVDTPTPLDL